MAETVFAFDVGTASLGEAVRVGNEIVHRDALLMPSEFGSIAEARTRRRQQRTREAHHAREEWLDQVCEEVGIEVLRGRYESAGEPTIAGDPRLEREFPAPGDDTCYTSCLLRIKLLEGEHLAPWQVYKALHSAIQRRGYDPGVPWKQRHRGEAEDEDAKENQSRAGQYQDAIGQATGGRGEWMYPCYFDAWKMGIWDPVRGVVALRIDHHAERARGLVPPRHLVEAEIRALLRAAARQFPALQGREDYVMYGPAETPYASFYPALREQFGLKEGGKNDWEGVLGQKIPRFENRVVRECALIPRYNACRGDDALCFHVHFLMRLLNMRYGWGHQETRLTPEQVRELFEQAKAAAGKYALKARDAGKLRPQQKAAAANQFKLTCSGWRKYVAKLGGTVLPAHAEVPAPKITGRSRFCRPAMLLLRELVLSGESPHRFHARKVAEVNGNTDPRKGLVPGDLDFLLRMPDAWEKIHVPAVPLAEQFAGEGAGAAVRQLLGTLNNPVFRHRLGLLARRLDALTDAFGTPDQVVFEFVREDFMGDEAKREFDQRRRQREKEYREAREKAELYGIEGKGSVLKYLLYKEQGGICLYTGEPLPLEDMDVMDIDHVVPRAGRYHGSDGRTNKVLTRHETNREKADRTPFEWLAASGKWEAYLQRVAGCRGLGRRKMALLTAENPQELDDNRQMLAETAWIARLARDVTCLKFGWQPGEAGEKRRITVIPGGLTARVRRQYHLDTLLTGTEDAEDAIEIEKKCRDDKRHHALDAMVLAYLPEWARNPQLQDNFELPDGVHRQYFAAQLAGLVPTHVAREKPKLEQTIYGVKTVDGQPCSVVRRRLDDLIPPDPKAFKPSAARRSADTIVDEGIRQQILDFLAGEPTVEQWRGFRGRLRQQPGRGSRVTGVRCRASDPAEMADVSRSGHDGYYRKDASHQGYYVYFDDKNRPRVRPVYAHESVFVVAEELRTAGTPIAGYFWSNCRVRVKTDISLASRGVLPAGEYTCSSIWADGRAQLTAHRPLPVLKTPVSLKALLGAGLERVDVDVDNGRSSP